MLYWIEDIDEKILESEAGQVFVEKLGMASKEGKICLFGKTTCLDTIASHDSLSSIARSSFTFALSNYAELGGRYSKVKRQVRVFITNSDIYKKNETEDSIIIECDYLKIPTDFNNPVTLLAENHKDAYFYELIAKNTNPYRNLGLDIKLTTTGGGGATITDHMNHYYRNKSVVFICIVDSDLKHPSSAQGDTAKQAKKSFDENNFFSDLFILDVHEAENIIPDTVINDIFFRKNDAKIEAIDIYTELCEIEHSAAAYIDLKNGISAIEALSIDKKHNKNYWTGMLSKLKRIPNCCRKTLSENEERCECFIFEGFGDKILEHSLSNLQSRNVAPVIGQMSDWKQGLWTDIGSWIAGWACCPKQGARRC
ncbi:MAG: hypothetical protein HWE39_05710 [Oceanospirillaceae bacterium]|nr:hypothetical protein [Oceanospirillaceae bacterium]